MSEDILVKAQSEIDVFERPSVMTSKELMAEIQKLRLELITSFGETQSALEKLEAAEARADKAENAIREAREQKSVGRVNKCLDSGIAWNDGYLSLNDGDYLFASPVPAMPIQDDKILSCMVCVLIHLLEFAKIETPTQGDLPQIESLIKSLRYRIQSEVKPS